MRVNLSKIEKFYHGALGQYALKTLIPHIAKMVDDKAGKRDTCIASASAFPFITLFQQAKRLSLQSFHDQSHWPDGGQGHYVLADRTHWPYRAEEADCVLLVHDIEFAEEAEFYLREAWRVLKGEGRLVLVISNRSGKWARYDNTPFGLGYPYTLDQIQKLLNAAHFTMDDVSRALFSSPIIPQSFIGTLWRDIVEKIGLYCLFQSGVYVIAASKHVYAPTKGLRATATEKAKQALFPKPISIGSTTHRVSVPSEQE